MCACAFDSCFLCLSGLRCCCHCWHLKAQLVNGLRNFALICTLECLCRCVLLLWRNLNNDWLGVVLTLAPAIILLCIQPYFNSLFTKVLLLVLLLLAGTAVFWPSCSASFHQPVCSASGGDMARLPCLPCSSTYPDAAMHTACAVFAEIY